MIVLQRRQGRVQMLDDLAGGDEGVALLQRLDALLAGGGLLGVLTGWPPSHWRDFAGWHYRRDPTHVAFYGPETLRWIARRLGWSVELPTRNVAIFAKPMRNG